MALKPWKFHPYIVYKQHFAPALFNTSLFLYCADIYALYEILLQERIQNHKRNDNHDDRRVLNGVLCSAASGLRQVTAHDNAAQFHLEVVPLGIRDIQLDRKSVV